MLCSNTPNETCEGGCCPLDTIELFAAMPRAKLQAIREKGRTSSYAKGQVLFMQDDPAEFFYMIEGGWVKLFRETLDGNEVILDVLPRGYIFGETAMLEKEIYPFGAEVVENARLTAYPAALLKENIQSDPALAMAMLEHIMGGNTLKDREIEHRTVMKAPQRIGCFLLRLCKVKQPAPIILHLPYDKTLIATRLGMQPETFSRALNRLQEDTGIKVRGATVEISDLGSLITYTCASCSNVFPCDD